MVDIEVANEGELILALANPSYTVIGVNDPAAAIALTTLEEIPAGKTVVLFSQLTPVPGVGLTVNGMLDVEGGAVLVLTGGITQPVKSSEIVTIPTTLTRRLDVVVALVFDILSLDTATSPTVPPSMTFTTADPLTYLLDLTIGEDWIFMVLKSKCGNPGRV